MALSNLSLSAIIIYPPPLVLLADHVDDSLSTELWLLDKAHVS